MSGVKDSSVAAQPFTAMAARIVANAAASGGGMEELLFSRKGSAAWFLRLENLAAVVRRLCEIPGKCGDPPISFRAMRRSVIAGKTRYMGRKFIVVAANDAGEEGRVIKIAQAVLDGKPGGEMAFCAWQDGGRDSAGFMVPVE